MTDNAPDKEDCGLIRDVLAGKVTEASHPWVFDEDALLFAVRRLEQDDPEWLLGALADNGVPFDRRAEVIAHMRRLRDQALALLHCGRPSP